MSVVRDRFVLLLLGIVALIASNPGLATSFKLVGSISTTDTEFVKSFLRTKLVDPGQSLDVYYQGYTPPFDQFEPRQIAWARHDLNGDGNMEFVFQFQHPGYCGSAGCTSYIFKYRDGKLIEIGEFYGGIEVELAEPINKGWPRLFSHEECLVWNGFKYDSFNNDPMDMGVDPECRRTPLGDHERQVK